MATESAALPQRAMSDESQEIFVASQWRLMWWRFKRHRLAVVSAIVLAMFYLVAAFAEFLATSDPAHHTEKFHYLRPQQIRFFDEGEFRPHVNGLKGFRDPDTFKKDYEVLPDEKIPVHFFVEGFEYKLLGLFTTNRHLIGIASDVPVEERPSIYFLGSDDIGRDAWSRLMIATRISLSIGLIGVAMSFSLGIVLGGISGYYMGTVDVIIQRFIEILRSIPTIPLWMALAASVPKDWSALKVYFAITVIVSVIAWTELARVVRGRFLSMREEDFVTAARLIGAPEMRIIFRHMLASFTSHIIAAISLAIPGMIIAETALSFLGLGLRPPAVSWGVMLQQAQNAQTVAIYPWLMFVAVPVIIAILAFNFMGDGLRDAADPYSN
jgi:peptide/nickel transport system permease protein